MLFAMDRHEPRSAVSWDEERARDAILRIVHDTEERFSPETLWPTHPMDAKSSAPQYALYWGACGVIWALKFLERLGAASLSRNYDTSIQPLLALNRAEMGQTDSAAFGAYLMGDTGIRLLEFWVDPSEQTSSELSRLIQANMD